MRKIFASIVTLTFIMCGCITFAQDKATQNPNPTGTIVGSGLLQNRYVYVDPTKPQEERPPEVQKLLNEGVFTAIQDSQSQPGVQTGVNNKQK
jgi:hypothetical protein